MTGITDHMVYLVVCGNRRLGDFLPERQLADCDRATTIRDIAAGQFEGLTQVLECNPVEKICNDVTDDIAREVMTVFASQGEPLSRWQRDFVEEFVGMQAAASFTLEAAE